MKKLLLILLCIGLVLMFSAPAFAGGSVDTFKVAGYSLPNGDGLLIAGVSLEKGCAVPMDGYASQSASAAGIFANTSYEHEGRVFYEWPDVGPNVACASCRYTARDAGSTHWLPEYG